MHSRNSGGGMQQVIQMCSSFDANKSTKGASKLRRDLINGEIANLRDLLPLPSSTRQRLSQLQLMALVCVYVRKANYFQQVFKRHHELGHPFSTPNFGFSKALSGFLIMMTQNGKLLYISDNAAEYLGHSMEDLLIHGDSVYDIIDKADHGTVQAELLRSSNAQNPPGEETRLFLCRMNVSRNARRQMRFGDQKVVLLQGHFLSYLPLCSRNEPVFVATCTPVAMPETRECVVQGATNVFTSIHAMDMKFMHIDRNGEYYLGYTRSELGGISWYQLIHWNYMREAQSKHRLISQSEQEKSCILLLRLQTRPGNWIWVHCVLQVKDGTESSSQQQAQQQSIIVATNQVLSEREAAVMRANAWLYHYYTVQTKLQYGLAYPEATGGTAGSPTAAAAAARLAAAAYFPSAPQLAVMNYGHGHGVVGQQVHGQTGPTHPHHYHGHPHPHHHPHHHHIAAAVAAAHHQISPDSSSGYSSITMPPPLHSPLNGHGHAHGAYGSSHPYSHHAAAAAFDMALTTGAGSGKESPLDFSLAASAASSVFEFPLGYGNPSYWTHHHNHNHPHNHPHNPHGYMNLNNPGNNLNSMGQTQSQIQNHHQRLAEGSTSNSNTTTVGASSGSPHNSHWSLLSSQSQSQSAPSGNSNHHHQQNHTHHHQQHQQHQQQQPPHHQASIASLATTVGATGTGNGTGAGTGTVSPRVSNNNSNNSLTSITNLSPSPGSNGIIRSSPSSNNSRSNKRMKKSNNRDQSSPPPTLSTNSTSNQPATRASLISSYSNINMNISLLEDGSGSDDTSITPLRHGGGHGHGIGLGHGGSGAIRNLHGQSNGGGGDVHTMVATSHFPYHHASAGTGTGSRLSYKFLDDSIGSRLSTNTTASTSTSASASASEDETSVVSIKEESMTMACPLTPSPIWEGQTQRVPDLQQQFYSHRYYNGGGGGGVGSRNGSGSGERDLEGVMAGGTDLIHCVPTYQPTPASSLPIPIPMSIPMPTYLQLPMPMPTTSTTSIQNSILSFPAGTNTIGNGQNEINNNQNSPIHPSTSAPSSHHHHYHHHHLMTFPNTTGLLQITETGSPNKENRLPATSESEHTEKDDNRGIKWESL